MAITITVPRLGWSMEEGAFVAWLKGDGEFVRAGEPLFSIEGDKAVQEVESLDSGVLRIAPNAPKPGDSIRVGDVLGHLIVRDETEASIPDPTPNTPSAARALPSAAVTPAVSDAAPAPRARSSGPELQSTAPYPQQPIGSATKVPTISPRALRAAAELSVDWTRVKGTGRTGRIRERDIRAAAAGQSRDSQSPSTTAQASQPANTKPDQPVVLVTGGAGFIGTWVVRQLLGEHCRVVVFDAGEPPPRWERIIGARWREVAFRQGSLLQSDLLGKVFADERISHVIHLAALLTPACQADPWEGCRVNVLGTVALFEQIRAAGERLRGFSYASSVAVFGDETEPASREEAIATKAIEISNQPVTFYGVFKKSVEMLADQYWRHYGVASVGLRPQVAYGPERETGLTAGPSLAAKAAACGESFRIGYTGRIGYDYVEDVARAFVRCALQTPRGASLLDLPGAMADVDEIIAAIIQAAPEAAGRITAEGPPIPRHAASQPRSITSLFPDWTTTSLTEGLQRTITYYRTA